MKIIISDISGFCFGVKRAFSMCEEYFGKNFQTFGPLIHNPDILQKIKESGGNIVNDIQDISSDTTFIRAHGISNKQLKKLNKKSKNIINTTCPFVERLQETASNYKKNGYKLIIIGQKNHPEILSITEDIQDALVIFSPKEAKKIDFYEKIGLLSQTTERQEKFEKILEILKKKCKKIEYLNTICTDVQKRQKAAWDISKKVEFVFVVGGKNSSNTKKLYEICNQNCKSILIENEKDVSLKMIEQIRKSTTQTIGICSGSSTSNETVEKVKNKLEKVFNFT